MKPFKPVFYFCKTVYRMSLSTVLCSLCSSLLKTFVPIISIMLSARLLDVLTTRESAEIILQIIALIVFINLTTNLLQIFLNNRFKTLLEQLKDDFSLHIGKKIMKVKYGALESARLQDLKQQALLPIIEWGTFEFVLNEFIPTIFSSIITIITTVFLVAEYSLFLMLPILLMVVAHLLLTNLKNKRFEKVMMKVGLIERKLGYYNMITSDFTMGKDIRIFKIDRILMNKIKKLNDKEVAEFSNLFYHAASIDFWETILIQVQVYIVYIVAALDLIKNAIGISYFFQITGLFVNFGNSMFQFMNAFVNLKARNRFLIKFMEFDQMETDEVKRDTCEEFPHEVEFSSVSFGYEGAQEEIITDISFILPKGQTTAIVGENGSGKTTIAKLLSGFLTPTAGEIWIDGKPLSGDAREYVAAIYQDFQLFAFSIKENVEAAYQNRGTVNAALEAVGLLSEVESLKAGGDTFLYKAFEENGIEFSYGQSQKLATARALYKNAGIIILDEPTSAYDAKAEYEIFRDFRCLIEGKTALLISHRLWSCKFCDEIMVVGDKRILERGTHDQLMAIQNGKYRTMFEAQAEYYDYALKADANLS